MLAMIPYLEMGWNVVNVEPRLPGVTLAPAAIQHSVCALRWVGQNASDYRIDARNLIISGSSSGGWFALGAAMAPRGWDAACPEAPPVTVAAVVNWFGVTDFLDVFQGPNAKSYGPGWVRGLVNPTEIAKSVSPLHFVTAGAPPIISVHGDADPTVPYSHSVRLHEALSRFGVANELVTIPGGLHGNFNRNQNERAFKAIEAFLAKRGITAQP
jgi:acetyl esterase/lipase